MESSSEVAPAPGHRSLPWPLCFPFVARALSPVPGPASLPFPSPSNNPLSDAYAYLSHGVGAGAVGEGGGLGAEGGDGGDDLGGVDDVGLVLESHGANGEGKDGSGELHLGDFCSGIRLCTRRVAGMWCEVVKTLRSTRACGRFCLERMELTEKSGLFRERVVVKREEGKRAAGV